MTEAEPAPISFTDVGGETGMTGQGKDKQESSAMVDLLGQLKNKKATKGDKSGESSGGKKKKKKKGGKTKKVRMSDRYESQNYLFRIEGTICCATLIMLVILLALNLIVFLIVYMVAEDNIGHIFHKDDKEIPRE